MPPSAVQLATSSNNGRISATASGLEVLAKVGPGDLIITAVGRGRVGKSSLLNVLAGCNAFKVTDATEACTRGLWIFGPVAAMPGMEGQRVWLVDSEGTDKGPDAIPLLLAAFSLPGLLTFHVEGALDHSSADVLGVLAERTMSLSGDSRGSRRPSTTSVVAIFRNADVAPAKLSGPTASYLDHCSKVLQERPWYQDPRAQAALPLRAAFGLAKPTKAEREAFPDLRGPTAFTRDLSLGTHLLAAEGRAVQAAETSGRVLAEFFSLVVAGINRGGTLDVATLRLEARQAQRREEAAASAMGEARQLVASLRISTSSTDEQLTAAQDQLDQARRRIKRALAGAPGADDAWLAKSLQAVDLVLAPLGREISSHRQRVAEDKARRKREEELRRQIEEENRRLEAQRRERKEERWREQQRLEQAREARRRCFAGHSLHQTHRSTVLMQLGLFGGLHIAPACTCDLCGSGIMGPAWSCGACNFDMCPSCWNNRG